MPAPYDLLTLHRLRSRGQAPKLPVFVTDSWDWQQRLLDLGALCIRVRTPQDCEHDWSALRGLHCILLHRYLTWAVQYKTGGYGQLGQALLAAGPAQLETFHAEEIFHTGLFSRLVVGTQEPLKKLERRDELLWRLLVK